jgi:FMN phosphatase YigB (HAD superfamily)
MTNILEREAAVLIPGMGLQKAAQETLEGMKAAPAALAENPLGATASYIGNHWQDFAGGAVIAAIAPSKMVTKFLLAYSLRGVGFATIDAAGQAALANADIDQIRDRYADRLAHEGTAFATALPMTIAGGAFGKMTANAVLGRGNSLYDVARGEVTMAEIRRNSQELMQSGLRTKTKVLITDLDDTVFPLKSYLVPSLQRNVAMISERMNIPEGQVIKALGPQRIHPWILEQSELARMWKGTPEQFTEQIVKPFWRNDAEAMRNLKPFSDVVRTLDQARADGITVVALTNAPRPWAIERLKAAGLDKHIDRLYAMDTPEPKLADLVSPHAIEHGRQLVRKAETAPHQIGDIRSLPQGYQKPDVHGIQTVLNDMGIKPRHALAIGDNWKGDGAAPEYFGVPFIWAKYGRQVNPEHQQFLQRFKPRADETKPIEPAKVEGSRPNAIHEASSYSDLLRFLNRRPSFSQTVGHVTDGITPRTLLPSVYGWEPFNK